MPILDISKLPQSDKIENFMKVSTSPTDISDQRLLEFISGEHIDSSLLRTSEVLFITELCGLLQAIHEVPMPSVNKTELTMSILEKYNTLVKNNDLSTFINNPLKNQATLKNFIEKMLNKGVKEKVIKMSATDILQIATDLSDQWPPNLQPPVGSQPSVGQPTPDLRPPVDSQPSVGHPSSSPSTKKDNKTAIIITSVVILLIVITIITILVIKYRKKRQPINGNGVNR